MNDTFRSWLEQRARLPGVLGCGLRLPDRTCLSQSNAAAFTLDKLDAAWQHAADAAASLAQLQLPATRLLWTFAEGQLHCAARPDGTVFCLVTPLGSEGCPPSWIEKVIAEFLAL